MYKATFTQTQQAQPMGIYNATSVDANKLAVDFRITQVAPFYIRWANGEGQIVSKGELNQLKALHTWTTDF